MLLLNLVLLSSIANAQAVTPNQPFKIQFLSANNVGELYHFKCDGTILKNYSATEVAAGKSSSPDPDGFYTFTLDFTPGLANGTHTCTILADNSFGSVESMPVLVPAGNAPGNVKGLKIIQTTVVIGGK